MARTRTRISTAAGLAAAALLLAGPSSVSAQQHDSVIWHSESSPRCSGMAHADLVRCIQTGAPGHHWIANVLLLTH